MAKIINIKNNKKKRFKRGEILVVYQITNLINKKSYIGITNNLKRRIHEHFNYSQKSKYYLHNAIKKYRRDNFEVSIIDKANTWKELCKKEIYWIKELNTRSPNGYNLTDGGEGVLGFRQIGRKVSKKTRGKISDTLMGHEVTQDTKDKISIASVGRTAWNKGKKLKPYTQEYKDNMSKIMMGKKHTFEQNKAKSIRLKNNKKEVKRLKKLGKANRKLSVVQVKEIKVLIKEKKKLIEIANVYSVGKTTILRIKNNKYCVAA